MADFPTTAQFPPAAHICNVTSLNSLVTDACFTVNGLGGAAVWPGASRAIFTPFNLDGYMLVKRFQIQVATQSGNVDVGLYDEKFNRIVTKGTTAVAAAGIQSFDLTASVTGTVSPVLGPGTYYMAMACDNTTASFVRQANLTPAGYLRGLSIGQMASAFVLPDPLVWASPASAYVPVMSIKGVAV